MPQPLLMLGAFAAAFALSAMVAAMGRSVGRIGTVVREVAAIGLGIGAGMFVLGAAPRWPPREDRDRFLLLVLPGVLLLEALLASIGLPRKARAAARLLAAAAVAPAVLFGSIHVADLAGPGSATWPPPWRYTILAALGGSLFVGWMLLSGTRRWSGSASRAPLALAMAIAGASACVMLSGYATGGVRGLPIAGAIAGAAIASARLGGEGAAAVAVGAVALFGLLLSGWAFGALKADAAIALSLAPLLCAIPEALPTARLKPRARTAIALALVATATAAVVGLTGHRFRVATEAPRIAHSSPDRSHFAITIRACESSPGRPSAAATSPSRRGSDEENGPAHARHLLRPRPAIPPGPHPRRGPLGGRHRGRPRPHRPGAGRGRVRVPRRPLRHRGSLRIGNHAGGRRPPGEVLKELLVQNRVSQHELARATGIAQSAISAIRQGTRTPTVAQSMELGIHFKLDPTAFLPL